MLVFGGVKRVYLQPSRACFLFVNRFRLGEDPDEGDTVLHLFFLKPKQGTDVGGEQFCRHGRC